MFTWKVLRFLDDPDFAIKIIPGGGARLRSPGQDTDSPDERARLGTRLIAAGGTNSGLDFINPLCRVPCLRHPGPARSVFMIEEVN